HPARRESFVDRREGRACEHWREGEIRSDAKRAPAREADLPGGNQHRGPAGPGVARTQEREESAQKPPDPPIAGTTGDVDTGSGLNSDRSGEAPLQKGRIFDVAGRTSGEVKGADAHSLDARETRALAPHPQRKPIVQLDGPSEAAEGQAQVPTDVDRILHAVKHAAISIRVRGCSMQRRRDCSTP